jgi:hypothetical protein
MDSQTELQLPTRLVEAGRKAKRPYRRVLGRRYIAHAYCGDLFKPPLNPAAFLTSADLATPRERRQGKRLTTSGRERMKDAKAIKQHIESYLPVKLGDETRVVDEIATTFAMDRDDVRLALWGPRLRWTRGGKKALTPAQEKYAAESTCRTADIAAMFRVHVATIYQLKRDRKRAAEDSFLSKVERVPSIADLLREQSPDRLCAKIEQIIGAAYA